MNVLVSYKGIILFNPDVIYTDGVTVKAKKGLDYYVLREYEDAHTAERLVSGIWTKLSEGKDKTFITIK
jgi:hypothetical protein